MRVFYVGGLVLATVVNGAIDLDAFEKSNEVLDPIKDFYDQTEIRSELEAARQSIIRGLEASISGLNAMIPESERIKKVLVDHHMQEGGLRRLIGQEKGLGRLTGQEGDLRRHVEQHDHWRGNSFHGVSPLRSSSSRASSRSSSSGSARSSTTPSSGSGSGGGISGGSSRSSSGSASGSRSTTSGGSRATSGGSRRSTSRR